MNQPTNPIKRSSLKENEKSRKKYTLEIITTSFSAIAIIVSVVTFNKQTSFEKLAINTDHRPLINIELRKVDFQNMKGLHLSNLGNGSAIIDDFAIFLNRKAFEKRDTINSWISNGNLIFNTPFRFEKVNRLVGGYIVPAEERGDFFLLGSQGNLLNPVKSEKDTTKFEPPPSFYWSDTREYMDSLIIEITYRSFSPLDDSTYFLRFCELCVDNNMRRADGMEFEYEVD